MGKKSKMIKPAAETPAAERTALQASIALALPGEGWAEWHCRHGIDLRENLNCVSNLGGVSNVAGLLASNGYLQRKASDGGNSVYTDGLPAAHSPFVKELSLAEGNLDAWALSDRCAIELSDPRGELRAIFCKGDSKTGHNPLFYSLYKSNQDKAGCFKKFALLCDVAALSGCLREAVMVKARKNVTLLFHTVEVGNVEALGVAIKLGVDVNEPDENAISPLKFVCRTGSDAQVLQFGNTSTSRRLKMVEMMLLAGADPNRNAAASCVARYGGGDIGVCVNMIVDAAEKCPLEVFPAMRKIALQTLQKCADDEIVSFLSESFINSIAEFMLSPLAEAVRRGEHGLVRLLLSHGADVATAKIMRREFKLGVPGCSGVEWMSAIDWSKDIAGDMAMADLLANARRSGTLSKGPSTSVNRSSPPSGDAPTFVHLCANAACGAPGTLRCSRCLNVRYCGMPCQRSAWKEHKKVCCKPP
mmetsp:Transcript_77154/g.151114  ORF Transcript_77154/g.151114 Transcript_77154/m.151114 type:complete len:474 (-) Transcript_77154:208-1629(-)|eukprot:CAMPEP_0171970474 /NCGR_PEP_ID=MMETSP0993-20121228/213065_1 /TAXON_ID=483369 /ORGANISM="non described non described, Strain CCMP2098" /LENGTH=473 /DNA_ID=CAMNT_0012620593 /DNA_START=80 /DNA_END=1501 /DNA_ORIENTATION=+